VLLYPFIFFSNQFTRLISRGEKHTIFSREEFQAIADIGFKEGQFHEQESRIIKNLFLLRKLSADDVMTPRTVMFALPSDMTVGDAVKNQDARFSRIPIYQENKDHIIGFVLKSDIYLEASRGNQAVPLSTLCRDLPAVPETVPLIQLFERFLKQRQQAALVVDEHGSVAGILTMEDIIETMLGIEIMDETDTVADMRMLARQQWLKRARALGIVTDSDQ